MPDRVVLAEESALIAQGLRQVGSLRVGPESLVEVLVLQDDHEVVLYPRQRTRRRGEHRSQRRGDRDGKQQPANHRAAWRACSRHISARFPRTLEGLRKTFSTVAS